LKKFQFIFDNPKIEGFKTFYISFCTDQFYTCLCFLPSHISGTLIFFKKFPEFASIITGIAAGEEFQDLNKKIYSGTLHLLREAIRRKRPKKWRANSWFLHHNNAPVLRLVGFGKGTF
jgi:hypothetical protein